jgi:hypothetical protein
VWSILKVCNRVSTSEELLKTISSNEIQEAIKKLAMFDRVVVDIIATAKRQPLSTFHVGQVSN